MSNKLPATLDLGLGSTGARTYFYARNVQRDGDWAKVGSIVGDYSKEVEIMIQPRSEFNKPEYIAQMKQHLLSFKPELVFADDQPGNGFISAEAVIDVCNKYSKLMGFEMTAIRENPEILHEIYLSAKKTKQDRLPANYSYTAANSLYPIMQVFSAVTEIVHGL